MQMLQAYKTWLHYEHRVLSWEIAARPEMVAYYRGLSQAERYGYIEPFMQLIDVGEADNFHRFDGTKPASNRAALVMSTVGCDWRERPDDLETRRA